MSNPHDTGAPRCTYCNPDACECLRLCRERRDRAEAERNALSLSLDATRRELTSALVDVAQMRRHLRPISDE